MSAPTPLRPFGVKHFHRFACNRGSDRSNQSLIFSLSTRSRADTPAPPIGPSALTSPPPRQALRRTWPSRAGPAGRPVSASLRRCTAPRPGDVPPARGPHHCSPHRARPGPGRALRSAARLAAAAGPRPLYATAAGPSGPGLRCHVTHAARRARGPRRGPLRRRRRTGVSVSVGEARGDAYCVPARVVLVGPSDREGAGRGRVPPAGPASRSAEPNTLGNV